MDSAGLNTLVNLLRNPIVLVFPQMILGVIRVLIEFWNQVEWDGKERKRYQYLEPW